MSESAKKSTQKSKNADQETATSQDASGATSATKNEELEADVNDLLDEIDDVLEENAEQFVKDFVQRGGQ